MVYKLNRYPLFSQRGGRNSITIAAGVVLIQNGKVLVVRESYESYFSFPGGTFKRGESLEHTAIRETKEELSLNITLGGKPFVYEFERYAHDGFELVILFHFPVDKVRGTLRLGSDAKELKWLGIDDDFRDCFSNVQAVVNYFIETYGHTPSYQIKLPK